MSKVDSQQAKPNYKNISNCKQNYHKQTWHYLTQSTHKLIIVCQYTVQNYKNIKVNFNQISNDYNIIVLSVKNKSIWAKKEIYD